jgi:hypothetical protein
MRKIGSKSRVSSLINCFSLRASLGSLKVRGVMAMAKTSRRVPYLSAEITRRGSAPDIMNASFGTTKCVGSKDLLGAACRAVRGARQYRLIESEPACKSCLVLFLCRAQPIESMLGGVGEMHHCKRQVEENALVQKDKFPHQLTSLITTLGDRLIV